MLKELRSSLILALLDAGYFTFWVIISIIWGLVRSECHCFHSHPDTPLCPLL